MQIQKSNEFQKKTIKDDKEIKAEAKSILQ